MRKKISNITLVVFLGVFFGAIFTNINSNNSAKTLRSNIDQKFDKEFSGKIIVIDGDSIKVGGKEVRLLEIDAPEYRQICFDANDNEYNCGKKSSSFLRKLAHKKEARCIYNEKDIYHRYLAKCFIGKISINEEILKNGMAVIYDPSRVSDRIIKLENSAKNKRIGIWQGAFQLPKDYRRANKGK